MAIHAEGQVLRAIVVEQAAELLAAHQFLAPLHAYLAGQLEQPVRAVAGEDHAVRRQQQHRIVGAFEQAVDVGHRHLDGVGAGDGGVAAVAAVNGSGEIQAALVRGAADGRIHRSLPGQRAPHIRPERQVAAQARRLAFLVQVCQRGAVAGQQEGIVGAVLVDDGGKVGVDFVRVEGQLPLQQLLDAGFDQAHQDGAAYHLVLAAFTLHLGGQFGGGGGQPAAVLLEHDLALHQHARGRHAKRQRTPAEGGAARAQQAPKHALKQALKLRSGAGLRTRQRGRGLDRSVHRGRVAILEEIITTIHGPGVASPKAMCLYWPVT
ncbi:hypothetical protein [Pseudoduganella sp. UC29_71]|uniref:hypothetical protein n=1 Tax=Pseudoduganella sp. UC29_71 TaxID=3350174 RepID=UPI00366D1FFD